MACGLGAVILIFLIIKHNVDRGSVEADTLVQQLQSLERDVNLLRTQVQSATELNSQEQRLGDDLAQQRTSAEIALAAIDARLTSQEQLNAQLRESIDQTAEQQAADLIESPASGEERYLLGLKVEGPRVAILLDHSGSMTNEKLIDVFQTKVGSPEQRRGSPKWGRAKRAARWLLNRVPSTSEAVVVGFSESATFVGDPGWQQPHHPDALQNTLMQVEQLVPAGGTNLQGALTLVDGLSPKPSHIYLITDGLPTQVNGRGRRCARGPTITPQCRLGLFDDMTQSARGLLSSARLNVVLLPLEGDWAAADAYWKLAVATGGLMISPAPSWP